MSFYVLAGLILIKPIVLNSQALGALEASAPRHSGGGAAEVGAGEGVSLEPGKAGIKEDC